MSELEKPFEIPEHWDWSTFDEIGEWTGGGTPSKQKTSYWEGDIPWVSPKDMKRLEIDDTQDHVTETALEDSATNRVPSSSLLFVTRSGILERKLPTALATVPVTINQDLKALTLSEGVDSRFLLYYSRAAERSILQQCSKHGTTVASLESGRLYRFPIPLPSLSEQRRIVAKIEELFSNLDAGMADLQTAGQQLERYRLSVLQAAVEGRLTADWRETHDPKPADQLLERILEKRREQWEEDYRAKYEAKGKEPPSGWKSRYTEPEPLESTDGLPNLPPGWRWASGDQMLYYVTSGSRGWSKYYDDEGQLFIRVGDISDPDVEIDFSDVQRVNLPDEERGHRSLLEPRDLLISITADIGKVGIVPQDIEEAYINQHVALTRPADPETTRYLAYYLISPGGGAKQFRKLQKGATKAGLTLTNIKELAIALPPAPELKQIVDEVERLLSVADDASDTADREHTRADRLRQSILKQAFSGQLVPHDDGEAPSIPGTSTTVANGKDDQESRSPTTDGSTTEGRSADGDDLLDGIDESNQIEMDL